MAGSFKSPNHILDLDDDALIEVFRYLDHYSQLDAMLVCRRFEALIGQNAQFFKHYKLAIRRRHTFDRKSESTSEDGPAAKKAKLMYFGRYFGEVKLVDYYFSPNSKFFPSLLATFENIGSKINKLEIKNSQGYKNPLVKVIQLANDVKELIIDNVTINETKSMRYKTIDTKNCTFPELKSLELSTIRNFENIKGAFDAVDSLHHLKLGYSVKLEQWEQYQQILFRQKALRSLDLFFIDVGNFELRNWNITKLVLRYVKFPKKEVFQTFVSFIKTLKNVSELEIDIASDERCYENDYKEILEHLMNLPSLKKLKWHSPQTANLKIHNPSVKSFFLDTGSYSGNYSQMFRHFPYIETLEFCGYVYNFDGLSTAMNSLANLSELKFEKMQSRLLEVIDCPQIQKFSIDGEICTEDSIWKQFVERHPNVESMQIIVKERNNSILHYIKHFKDFPKLKTLKYHDFVDVCNCKACNGIWIYKIIGHYFSRLEHLEIVVREENVGKAVVYLHRKFPHLGCDTRKIQNVRKSGVFETEGDKRDLNCLISLRMI
jgi:hypothetical protein